MKKTFHKKKGIISLSLAALLCVSGAAISVSLQKPAAAENSEVSVASPSSLFNVGKGITVKDNVDIPDYAKNGLRVHQADWTAIKTEEITPEKLDASRLYGVGVESKSETSRLQFKNVINVDGFTKNDTLVEFIPITDFRVSSANFEGMKVWITDADDESNWICLDMYALDPQYDGHTRMHVLTSTGIDAAYRWGGYQSTPADFYEGGRADFYGTTEYHYYDLAIHGKDEKGNALRRTSFYDCIYEPLAVSYDAEDMSVWVSGETYGQKKCVFDLDDFTSELYVNENNVFKGFKNNRVKLALQTYDIMGEAANYVIMNVANQPMNGTKIVDTDAAEILERLPEGGIPTANVGKDYTVFDPEFYDLFDGVLPYKTYVKEKYDTDFKEVQNGAFKPEKQSEYILRYEATDAADNTAVKEYVIPAQYALPKLELVLEEGHGDTYGIGARIPIPAIEETRGGSGPLQTSVKVVRLSDGAFIEHDGKYFVPYLTGEYAIEYTLSDYVGNVLTTHLKRIVESDKTPVFASELTMYKRFISGVKVQLPEVAIYDYDSVFGLRLNAITEVTVASVSKANVTEKVENYAFTPTLEKFGDKVTVTYSTYCREYPDNKITKSFDVEIVKSPYSKDYLWGGEGVTVDHNQASDGRNKFASITATAAGDATFGFINPLYAEGCAFQFDTDEGKDTFERILVEMTDFIDGTQKISYVVEKDVDGALWVVNGKDKVKIFGGYGENKQNVLTYSGGKLTDYSGTVAADFGNVQFTSGRVWFKVTLVGALEGTCLKVTKMGSHSFFANYSGTKLLAYKDTVKPTVVLDKPLVADADIYEQVTVSSAKAYDACSPYMETKVTVTAPDGTVVLENLSAAVENTFIATQYGLYTVTYTAVDATGAKQTPSFAIGVFDVTAPVILYEGENELLVKAGKAVTFDSVRVYDAADENLTVLLFVVSPNGPMVTLGEDRTYTFTETGKYVLRYCVYDSNFNYAYHDVTIKVGK